MNGSSFFFAEIMFASFTNGDIIKCSTTTNPCKVLAEWKCSNPQSKSKNAFLASKFETVIMGCVRRAMGLTLNIFKNIAANHKGTLNHSYISTWT